MDRTDEDRAAELARYRRYKSLVPTGPDHPVSLYPPTVARFWLKVNKNGPVPPHRPELGPCWLWTGARDRGGYGQFSGRAHRWSWLIHHGYRPGHGLFVCHHCDNPPCVRPDHLFLGTASDNARDMVAKGRQGRRVGVGWMRERKPGYWEVRVPARNGEGKPTQISRYVRGTRDDADRLRVAMLHPVAGPLSGPNTVPASTTRPDSRDSL